MSRLTCLVITFVACAAAADDNAVTSATDAFGERVGTEQSGLYSETQVRGFNLNDSGAYRIDDAYFSRAAALNDPVLAGVGRSGGRQRSPPRVSRAIRRCELSSAPGRAGE